MRFAPWLLLLQGLVGPPALNRCVNLPQDIRAACEAQQMDTLQGEEARPILPDRRPAPPPDEERPPTGHEFNSPSTFSGDENGAPGF
jgi:hypothetical protein